MITVITFYTPEYHDEAMQLIESCNRFSVPCNAYPKTSKGSWVHNCTMKAEVIEEALNEFSHGVVWIDADGRLRNVPSIFDQLNKYDFGCYWIPNVWNQPRNVHLKPWTRGNEALAGGTLYFNNTSISKELISAWKKESQANPTRWEQQSLQKVWEEFDNKGLRTYNFPQSYCKVFDCKWFEVEQPVIVEHMQASRILKHKIK
jgi:hypothetical protein